MSPSGARRAPSHLRRAIASSGPLKAFALAHNGDLREEIGWDDLLQQLAALRDALPPAQQQSLGIVTGNYGETGDIEL